MKRQSNYSSNWKNKKQKHYNERGRDRERRGAPEENPEEEEDDRIDFTSQERHPGSYPYEQLQLLPEYQRRILPSSSSSSSKRKYALALCYCGTNYSGLQLNPNAITIEYHLEKALYLAGSILDCNYGYLQKISWTRSARTDKGVHAIKQCCSMKLHVPEDHLSEYIEQVNSFLPSDIQLIGLTRTTKSFNARTHCSHRCYEYLLPTYLLQSSDIVQTILLSSQQQQQKEREKDQKEKERQREIYNQIKGFRVSRDLLERFNSVLQNYSGTHSYHNFTPSVSKNNEKESSSSSPSPSMTRYMMRLSVELLNLDSDNTNHTSETEHETETEFKEGKESNEKEVEWIKITITGQSFLLNQIRKMVGLAVELTRSNRTLQEITQTINHCFQPQVKV